MIQCENCNEEFDPIASRWLCPNCHYKANCCEGEAQPQWNLPPDITLPTLYQALRWREPPLEPGEIE